MPSASNAARRASAKPGCGTLFLTQRVMMPCRLVHSRPMEAPSAGTQVWKSSMYRVSSGLDGAKGRQIAHQKSAGKPLMYSPIWKMRFLMLRLAFCW